MSAEPKLKWPCPCGCTLVIDEDGNESVKVSGLEVRAYAALEQQGIDWRPLAFARAVKKCKR